VYTVGLGLGLYAHVHAQYVISHYTSFW